MDLFTCQDRVCMCLQAALCDLKVKCFENVMPTHLFFSSSLCVDLRRQKTEVVKYEANVDFCMLNKQSADLQYLFLLKRQRTLLGGNNV